MIQPKSARRSPKKWWTPRTSSLNLSASKLTKPAGGITRADLFGDQVYLETPALLHKLAEQKLAKIRKELEAEGWGWVEVNADRDYDAIHHCGRIKPQLIGAPDELVRLKTRLDDELAVSDDDSESEAIQNQLDEVEGKLAAYVGFDQTQKRLAGCFVSIGHDGTPFVDKGLVKPERRKALATLLGEDEPSFKSAKPKQTGGLPESLRRSLAADRLPIAQLAIASQPDIALDLLTFTLATGLLDEGRRMEGIDVSCKRPRGLPQSGQTSDAARKFAAIECGLPAGWRKSASEAERFEAFRSLPQERKQTFLACCVAAVIKPTLGFPGCFGGFRLRCRTVVDRRQRRRVLETDQGQFPEPTHSFRLAGYRP